MSVPLRDHKVGVDRINDYPDRIDVRSPSEFADDHIPGAVSCPVLDDAERAGIGYCMRGSRRSRPSASARRWWRATSPHAREHIRRLNRGRGRRLFIAGGRHA
jgi:hypothetical protein